MVFAILIDKMFGKKEEPTALDAYLALVEGEKSRVRELAALPAPKDDLKKLIAARMKQANEVERDRLKKAYLLLADFQDEAKESDARDAMIGEVKTLMTELKVIEAAGAVH